MTALVNQPTIRQKYTALAIVLCSHLLFIWLLVYLHRPYALSAPPQIKAIKVHLVNMQKSNIVAPESTASAQAAPKSIPTPQPQKDIPLVQPVEKIKQQPKIIESTQSERKVIQQPKAEPIIKKQEIPKPAPAVSQNSHDDGHGKVTEGSKLASQGQGIAQGEAKTSGGSQEGNDKTVSQAQAAPVADDVPLQVNAVDVLSFGKLPYTDKDLQNQSRQVILTIYVDAKGHPTQVQIKKSTGLDYLDQLAVKAAQKARFKPYKVNGQGKSIVVDMPINFEMNRRGR